MLRIKENNLGRLESYGFEPNEKEWCFWNRGIKKIIIYKSDGRIRFNCMDLQSYDVLFDLIVADLVEKTDYYKRTTAEDSYAALEKRIKELEEKLKEKEEQ